MKSTGHYWFAIRKFLQDSGMKPVRVKELKELDDNKDDRKGPKMIGSMKGGESGRYGGFSGKRPSQGAVNKGHTGRSVEPYTKEEPVASRNIFHRE